MKWIAIASTFWFTSFMFICIWIIWNDTLHNIAYTYIPTYEMQQIRGRFIDTQTLCSHWICCNHFASLQARFTSLCFCVAVVHLFVASLGLSGHFWLVSVCIVKGSSSSFCVALWSCWVFVNVFGLCACVASLVVFGLCGGFWFVCGHSASLHGHFVSLCCHFCHFLWSLWVFVIVWLSNKKCLVTSYRGLVQWS